jgi:predicted NAD/FAD-binding protein
MRMTLNRAVLTVTRSDGVWSVEHEGQSFGHSADKEVAKAAANRRALQMLDGGQPCQVKVWGEMGFRS